MSSPGGLEESTRRYDAPEAPEHGPPPRAVLAELHELWVHRALLSNFVINDLKFRYIGSSIGFFWTVVNPLLELITYTFVFHIVLDVKFHASGGTVHYSLFLFCGMVAWFGFADGVKRATDSVVGHAHLIKKVNFPAAILPAHVVLSAAINQVVRFGILALGVVFFGRGLGPTFLLLPAFILLQALFTLGLAFLLSTANVFFRDTSHWVGALLMPWMFLSPIFYPHSAYPKSFGLLVQLNPMAHIVGIYQEIVLNQALPDVRQVMFAVLFSVSTLVIGFSVFVHHRRKFADLT
jgi:ABC-type polysaccharide/polyol phosphate export permease